MNTERNSTITIGDEQYSLVLTTRATKEIAGRYGGLENLGEKLMKSENFEMAIGEIVWLMPFGLLLDLWECHKQYHGISKPKREVFIDDIIPYGI